MSEVNEAQPVVKPKPYIVAFVSGKGGVGKTMLAVAFANEIAEKSRTLLVDLDFFNRGLTGLLQDRASHGEIIGSVRKPAFLVDEIAPPPATEQWDIVEVSENIFSVKYPRLTSHEMRRFATRPVHILQQSLKEFIDDALRVSKCDAVVLDCHGGPDNSSFAACLIADDSLLISEPDKITFHGTLNFKKQLDDAASGGRYRLHLVFNKVVPAFSTFFLYRIYDRSIRKFFDGNPLLAIFPLEMYLTKEFEKTPFLTSVYPKSLLCRKTRKLLVDLFEPDREYLIPNSSRHLSRVDKIISKYSLGKNLPLFNLDAVLPTIACTLLLISSFYWSFNIFYGDKLDAVHQDIKKLEYVLAYQADPSFVADNSDIQRFVLNTIPDIYSLRYKPELRKILRLNFPEYVALSSLDQKIQYFLSQPISRSDDKLIRASAVNLIDNLRVTPSFLIMANPVWDSAEFIWSGVIGFCVLWFLIVLLLSWSSVLQRRFYYFSRQKKWGSAVLLLLIGLFLWGAAFGGPATVFLISILEFGLTWQLVGWFGLLLAWTPQIVIGVREVRWQQNRAEGVIRIGFVAFLLILPLPAMIATGAIII